MLVGVTVEIINKKEVVGWTNFWAHGEKLAHVVVAVLLLGIVKVGQGAQEQHQWCPGYQESAYRALGRSRSQIYHTSSSPRCW